MSNLGEVEAVDDLFSEFGSPQKTAAHSLLVRDCRTPFVVKK